MESVIAIKMSWLQPHKGHAHADFRRHIEQGWRSGGGVIHDFDIVQSRWVGTSRMVDELAKECLVIPISLGCDTLQSKPRIVIVFFFRTIQPDDLIQCHIRPSIPTS